MSGKKKTIIILDNNLEVHHFSLSFFKIKGFNIKSFFNAETALKDLESNKDDWEVLLTDYQFDDMPIESFVSCLSESKSDLPIYPITSFDLTGTSITVDRLKNGESFKKAIHFKDLYSKIQKALSNNVNFEEAEVSNKELSVQGIAKAFDSRQNLIGSSDAFLKTVNLALKVSRCSSTILISGESGTGKEVFANFIHANSKLKGKFVAINCSSIPENLLESELFGHAKGSFTGAIDKKIGLCEIAEDGTIFLDEIGDLSLPLQAKLLRVLQEKKIRRVGENKDIPINCRVITATHKNLAKEVEKGRFREDLYFRINVIPIKIPPLRDRREDILPLAEAFLKRFSEDNNLERRFFSKNAIQWLLDNPWRGNVRELENSIERAVVLSNQQEIHVEDFIPPLGEEELSIEEHFPDKKNNAFYVEHTDGNLPSLEYVKNCYISYAIEINDGAKDKTAKEIGIDRKTLYKRERALVDKKQGEEKSKSIQ